MPAPLRPPPLAPAADGSDSFEILGWRVFGPGYWKGDYYPPARVARIVANYRTLKAANPDYAPRAKLGHDKQQRLAQSLGLPNAGRVTDLRPLPDGWFEIDVRGIPRTALLAGPDGTAVAFDLHEAFAAGQYDSGSVEISPAVPHPDRPTETLRDVFDGIAFLGEENPALKGVGRPPLAAAEFSSGAARVLCFSDYSEVHPMREQWIQTIGEKLGLPPDDPQLQSMTEEQLQAWADKLTSETFSSHMKKQYSAPPPAPPPGAPDMTAFMSEMKKTFSEMIDPLAKRLEAAEAAVSDTKKKADDAQVEAMMSEAVRVVDECVGTGRLLPRLKPQKLADLKALASDTKTFSDGPDKGLTAFQAELKSLKARQPDAMFSEHVRDTPDPAGAADLDDWDRRALDSTPRGKAILAGERKAAAK